MAVQVSFTPAMIEEVIREWERDHPGKQKGQALRLAPSSFLDLWLISF